MPDEPYQITERGDPRDRIHNQRELFDVGKTVSTACPVPGCGAIRLAGEDEANECISDRENERATEWRMKRPRGCLNTIDPAHTPWPEGF